MPIRDVKAFEHSHIFHESSLEAERNTLRVVLLTLVMMVVEIVAGWLFNSMALLADGWHMSTHAAALAIAWGAFIFARRHAGSSAFTFGTWKVEILGGFVSAIILGVVAVAMAWVSVSRLLHPETIQFNQAILVAAIGLAVNLVSMVLLTHKPHGHSHGYDHHAHDHHAHGHTKNLNLRAAYLHVAADALTSVLAVAALVVGKCMGWTWPDPAMGIVGAVLIARWTYHLVASTGGVLLDRGGNPVIEAEIREAIETDDTRITDIHLWQVGQDRFACVLSLVANHPQDAGFYKEQLRAVHELAHVTVEVQRS
jgi:cation diffusion facilitator family transporter